MMSAIIRRIYSSDEDFEFLTHPINKLVG